MAARPQESGRGIAGFGPASVRGPVLSSVRLVSGTVALSILLSGCALLGGGSKPLDTYELTAPAAGDGRGTEPPADTDRRALGAEGARRPEHRDLARAGQLIQYLKGAQWADRLPKVIQARLAETFQRSRRIQGVGRPGEGLAIDYQVIVEIRSFEVRVRRRRQRQCRTVRSPAQRPQRHRPLREGVHRHGSRHRTGQRRLCRRARRRLRTGGRSRSSTGRARLSERPFTGAGRTRRSNNGVAG